MRSCVVLLENRTRDIEIIRVIRALEAYFAYIRNKKRFEHLIPISYIVDTAFVLLS